MRLGILTDIHEDIESLTNAFQLFESKKVDEIICLGDIIGYDSVFNNYPTQRDASACVNLIKVNCKYSLNGNHELFSIKRNPPDIRNFSFPAMYYHFSLLNRSIQGKEQVWLYENEAINNLSEEDFEYLKTLPNSIIINESGKKYYFSHHLIQDVTGSGTELPRYVDDFKEQIQFLKENKFILGVSGHLHPRGLVSIEDQQLNLIGFGKHYFLEQFIQLICPSVCKTNPLNGISILDLKESCIETIFLRKLFRFKNLRS